MKRIIAYILSFSPFLTQAQSIGDFTSVQPNSQDAIIHIPSTHKFQVLIQSGNTIPGSSATMPTMLDFTGFVSQTNSSREGALCVNSEFLPGGVSILDIQYDSLLGYWKINSGNNVSFGGLSSGTVANCGGTITPWKTMVTCEENEVGFDFNFDGYTDYGWNIEIDPFTKTVIDQDNNGTPDKLWKMGRFKHENIVVASDSLTVYQGEDNSSNGFLFKYVMNQKTKLADGSLYVLKWDDNSAGEWVQVPNATQSNMNNTISQSVLLFGTNFDRVEDVEIGPDGKIYFTSTTQGKVFRFDDLGDSIANFETFVDNVNFTVNYGSGNQSVNFNSPDNLAFDNEGNLWVCQDGGGNFVWRVKPSHTSSNPQIDVFAVMPEGSEPTGIFFTPDGKFMFLDIQHPSGSNNVQQQDVTGNQYTMNADATIVIALNETWGTNPNLNVTQQLSFAPLALKNIYPNPAGDFINILLYADNNQNVNLELFSLDSKSVRNFSKEISQGDNFFNLDVSGLSSGIYILKISNGNHVIEGHLLKK